jgi:hypothetical protein
VGHVEFKRTVRQESAAVDSAYSAKPM